MSDENENLRKDKDKNYNDAVKVIQDLIHWNILINPKENSIPKGLLKEMNSIIDNHKSESV